MLEDGEAGLCLYQIFCGHAGIYLRRNGGSMSATVRYRIRNLEHEAAAMTLDCEKARLRIRGYDDHYDFEIFRTDGWQKLATLDAPLLSTEVVGGFTGITTGPLCIDGSAAFEYFRYEEY